MKSLPRKRRGEREVKGVRSKSPTEARTFSREGKGKIGGRYCYEMVDLGRRPLNVRPVGFSCYPRIRGGGRYGKILG